MHVEISEAPHLAESAGLPDARSIRWLHAVGGAQYWLVAAWFAFVLFLPPNLYGLVFLFWLLPVWGVAALLALWHLVKTPGERLYAVGMIVVPPAVVFLAGVLTDHLPLVSGRAGVVSLFAVLFSLPALWLTRWLWRMNVTADKDGTSSLLPSKALAVSITALIGLSLLLILGLFTNNVFQLFESWFGQQWLANGLFIIGGLIIGHLAIATPYAVRAIRKGNRRSGVILAVVTGVLVVALLIGSVLYMLLALTYG